MNIRIIASMFIALIASGVNAEQFQIEVPNGWTATESSIVKGNSTVSIGPVLDVGDIGIERYLGELAKEPLDGTEITSVGELKMSDQVAQVNRKIVANGGEAWSVLIVCLEGRNKHRLLEVFADKVWLMITGAKAAFSFCRQS